MVAVEQDEAAVELVPGAVSERVGAPLQAQRFKCAVMGDAGEGEDRRQL